MDKVFITVTLRLEVHDLAAFAAAAKARALYEGLSEEEWAETRESGFGDNREPAHDAIMLFDPGVSPTGCDIQDCVAEVEFIE